MTSAPVFPAVQLPFRLPWSPSSLSTAPRNSNSSSSPPSAPFCSMAARSLSMADAQVASSSARPLYLEQQEAAPLSPFPRSPTKSTRRRCSTKCAAPFLHGRELFLAATASQGQRVAASPWPWSATRCRALHVRCFAQQLRRLHAARCFVLRSKQPSTPAVCSLFCAAPISSSFTPETNPVFCGEKASRSTLVDVRSDAQIGITVVLANADWVCLWTERCRSSN
uniref:Uncharacterized protein n=1 Tax=Zea mays TaxID=4577 RepID=A0A804UFZ4_MAIZE